MRKINTIIKKEWMQVFKNRMVLFSTLFLPLFFTALPLVILAVTGGESAAEGLTGEMPAEFIKICPAGMNAAECSQVFIVTQFMLLFMTADHPGQHRFLLGGWGKDYSQPGARTCKS